ncbi:hypothetical protein CMV_020348 [Castanea mollissima]|uniref:Uncharacterized protein n=1 Tax=Castanea mollissima TaxID=60419 RepID=A0A8J4QZ46_9ROSI|nr:hypothetical protein CMV_020348 [Castanea mollissima]
MYLIKKIPATRKGKSFHARVIPLLFFPQEPENWSYQYSSLSSFDCRLSVPLLADGNKLIIFPKFLFYYYSKEEV